MVLKEMNLPKNTKLSIEKINNKQVLIFDNLFDNSFINDFFDFTQEMAYHRHEKSTKTDEYPKFAANFNADVFVEKTRVGQMTQEILKNYIGDYNSYKPFRVYTNQSNYGDVEWPHRDCSIKKDDITFLYYANNEWDYTYGGETLFYLNKEAKLAVMPKPGRLIMFDGNIEHKGGLPTRTCKYSRYTIAIKYSKDEK